MANSIFRQESIDQVNSQEMVKDYLRVTHPRLWMVITAVLVLLAGAAGNFIDRLAFGYVTDMFQTTFMDFPVFNVADIGVVVGGFFLVLAVLTAKEEKKP